MKIIIDIDVTNPEQVIKAHKGQIVGLLSDMVMSKEQKKKKVNLSVCTEIVKVLQEEMPGELAKEMVEANITYRIVPDEEDELYV